MAEHELLGKGAPELEKPFSAEALLRAIQAALADADSGATATA